MPVRKSHLEIVRCVGKTSPCAWEHPSLLETEARDYGHSSPISLFNSAANFFSDVGFHDDVTIVVVKCHLDGSPGMAA